MILLSVKGIKREFMKMRIIVVDDDKNYGQTIQKILEKAEYEVDVFYNPLDAIEAFPENQYDLIISDLKMDVMEGTRLIGYAKKMFPAIHSIILTGNATPESEITALDLQVDRYLSKDVRQDVLLKYVDLILSSEEKNTKPQEQIYTSDIDDIQVYVRQQVVKQNDKEVMLSYKEFKILCYLLENKGYAVSREELIEVIWDDKHETVDERVIDTHIKKIRKKIRITALTSIRGYGYKINV